VDSASLSPFLSSAGSASLSRNSHEKADEKEALSAADKGDENQ
jgi:hypothetical protein